MRLCSNIGVRREEVLEITYQPMTILFFDKEQKC